MKTVTVALVMSLLLSPLAASAENVAEHTASNKLTEDARRPSKPAVEGYLLPSAAMPSIHRASFTQAVPAGLQRGTTPTAAMSTGAKIAIGAGVVAAVLVVAFYANVLANSR